KNPENETHKRARAALTKAEKRRESVAEKRDRIAEVRRPLLALLDRVQKYLAAVPGPTLDEHPAIAIKLRNGETAKAAIDRVRKAREQLEADRHELQSKPHFLKEAKELARRQIESRAAKGKLNVSTLIDTGSPIMLPLEQ